MSNYYVRRNHDYDDELEHSLGSWIKARARGAHKYIAKIPVGGKMRYFYSQAELAAYKAGKTVGKAATNVKNRLTVGGAQARYTVKRISDTARTKTVNAINKATGVTAKRNMQNAADKLTYEQNKMRANIGNKEAYNQAKGRAIERQRAYNKAESAYNKSLLGRAERAGKALGGVAGKVRNAANKAGNRILDAAGRSEKERLQRLDLNYRHRVRTEQLNPSASYEESKRLDKLTSQAGKAASRAANSYYRHTLMGRAENAASKAKSAVSDAAYKVRSTAGKAKSAASSAAGTVRKTAKKAKQAAVDTIGYKKRAAAQLKTNYANGLSRSKVYDPEAHRTARVAQKEYNRTLMGRAESAGRAIGSAANNARRTASNTYNNAANTVKDWRKKRYLKRQSRKGQNA